MPCLKKIINIQDVQTTDETDRVFRKVRTENSDAGESPKMK